MEIGDAASIYGAPAHPYIQALMQSIATHTRREQRKLHPAWQH